MLYINDSVITIRDGETMPGVIVEIMDAPNGDTLYCVKNDNGCIWYDDTQLTKKGD